MKHAKITWTMALIAGGIFLATASLAMEHQSGHETAGNHGDMQQMQGMQEMKPLPGVQEVDGVKAMFHLVPIDPKVLPEGHEATHHLMVMFNDTRTGKSIDSGTVAVKITDPEQVIGKPVKMMGMQGHFGVDVNLDRPGVWHFRIAAKLADGKVRQFHTHTVKK
ncbi:MAG: hypothetical protein PWP34_1567 [Desulfuromonadales bacterium]|jgi:hypothetical protein|nr:hypothetical protein [Desulfuromonadales bacterium]